MAPAWLLASGEALSLPVVPSPGTRSPERVSENAAAARLVLDADAMRRLDAAAALVRAAGT